MERQKRPGYVLARENGPLFRGFGHRQKISEEKSKIRLDTLPTNTRISSECFTVLKAKKKPRPKAEPSVLEAKQLWVCYDLKGNCILVSTHGRRWISRNSNVHITIIIRKAR